MGPYHENVVNETPPSMWLVWPMQECVCLEFNLARNRLAYDGAMRVPMAVLYFWM